MFDCLSHELVLMKLHGYGFRFTVLRLLHSILEIKSTGINLIQVSGRKYV